MDDHSGHCRIYAQHIKGSIINIFSTLEERRPITGASAACVVSKPAVIHLTRQLVQELSPHNIRINCIIPRMFATELTEKRLKSCGDEIKKRIPLGFVGEPEDLDAILSYTFFQ
ncbi:MAG: SDR family oxidoreductase [Alphaproteobacteria bacterium]|nr:SDR family oxidoreductase [Alphaproteobacteria bacterium]